ncbi:hypothetical protein [Streptomyces coerulescens]|uniref:Uncharacterized protein n=1 Tax=Streptomyces coerulescens TaxID=29304 RepID=A0ABW0CPM2_STRCD
MAFIPVRRKPAPEPEPKAVDEGSALEDQDDEQDALGDEAAPAGVFGALAAGVRGWLTWCSLRIGVRGTYGLHVVAVWAAGYYSVWVTWGVVIGLAAAVVTFVPRESLDRLLARLEHPRAKATVKAAEQAPVDPLPALVWRLIGDAPGVHRKTLTAVLARAAEKEGTEPPTEAQVEAALTARNIPLRPSVRDTRGKVNRGVHRVDLEAWARTPSPPPSDAPATDP